MSLKLPGTTARRQCGVGDESPHGLGGDAHTGAVVEQHDWFNKEQRREVFVYTFLFFSLKQKMIISQQAISSKPAQ